MPIISNRSSEHWEFGPLKVPPGDSYHDAEEVDWAWHHTAMKHHVVMVDDPLAASAKFVLDMGAEPEPVPPIGLSAEQRADLNKAEKILEDLEAEEGTEVSLEVLSRSRQVLEAHDRKELRSMAVELGIDEAAKMLKADLVEALLSWDA